jgi:hypothetical protein
MARLPLTMAGGMVVALAVGFLVSSAVRSWMHDEVPMVVVPGHAVVSADGQWLLIDEPRDDRGCTRLTSHLLYSATEPETLVYGKRQYIVLPSALNGLPFPGALDEYSLRLAIPPTLRGRWYYVARSEEACWPAYLSRWTFTTTPPLLIDLGDEKPPGG